MKFYWPLQKLLDVTEMRKTACMAELYALSCRIAELQEEALRREKMMLEMLERIADMPISERASIQPTMIESVFSEKQYINGVYQMSAQLEEEREEVKERLLQIRNKGDRLSDLRGEAKVEYNRQIDLLEQSEADDQFQASLAGRMSPGNYETYDVPTVTGSFDIGAKI